MAFSNINARTQVRCRHLKDKKEEEEEEEEEKSQYRHVDDDEEFTTLRDIDLRPRRLHQDDRTLALAMLKMNTDLDILNGIDLRCLERCDLQNRKMYAYEIAFVANKLRGHLDLEVLNLSNTNLTPQDMFGISRAIRGNRALRHVDVSHNPIGSDAAVELIKTLASRST